MTRPRSHAGQTTDRRSTSPLVALQPPICADVERYFSRTHHIHSPAESITFNDLEATIKLSSLESTFRLLASLASCRCLLLFLVFVDIDRRRCSSHHHMDIGNTPATLSLGKWFPGAVRKDRSFGTPLRDPGSPRLESVLPPLACHPVQQLCGRPRR